MALERQKQGLNEEIRGKIEEIKKHRSMLQKKIAVGAGLLEIKSAEESSGGT